MKKWMAYLFVAFLLLGVFPLLSTSTGAQDGDARAGEIVINFVEISGEWGMNNDLEFVHEPGQWNVTVDFNLTVEITQLNITVNVTEENVGSEVYFVELGTVGIGNNVTETWLMNFTNETSYNVNVTIGNATLSEWESADLMVEDFPPLLTDFGIAADSAVTGEFANETHNIMVALINFGDENLTDDVTINVTVTNATDVIVQQGEMKIGPIDSMDVGFALFEWTPAEEATYYINMSYNCTDFGGMMYYGVENLTVVIANVTSYAAEIIVADDMLLENEFLTAWIIVNNTGNQDGDFGYVTNVTKAGGWDHGEPGSTGLLSYVEGDDEHNHTLTYMMDEGGDYAITVTFDLDDDSVMETFSVQALYGMVSGKVNDTDGGNVSGADVVIMNATGAWFNDTTDASGEYSLELLFDDYEIYINATGYDDSDNETFTLSELNLEEVYDFTLEFWESPYVPPTEGTISGRVSTGTGNDTAYIANATVIISMTTVAQVTVGNNTTNVTTIDFFNATTDADGNYTKTLDFGEYGIYVTKTGYADATEATVVLDIDHLAVTKDFSLTPITTGVLSGMVTSGTGNDTVNIDGTVVICMTTTTGEGNNTTTMMTYYNTTSVNGSYTKTLAFGTYTVYAMADGYDDPAEATVVLDLDHQAVTKDFSLVKTIVPPPTYTITGTVTPADATITFSGTETVTVNTTTGAFSVAGLVDGNYTLTFAKTGYKTQTKTVVINGSAPAALTITLVEDIVTFEVTIGPLLDKDGKPVEGATVTFEYDGITYSEKTGADGIATFTGFPVNAIPAGTNITATKGDETFTWAEGDTLPEFAAADDGGESSLLWLWIVIIIVVTIIIIVVVMMKKKPAEAPMDLEEEEMEEGLGEDYDEDMDEMDEEEDFGEFEGEMDDEEMEGVDDLADELEEFDEEEDFEEEDLGDYEEDIDDEFDDEFDDEDGDFDDEDFDDDEFDDDF